MAKEATARKAIEAPASGVFKRAARLHPMNASDVRWYHTASAAASGLKCSLGQYVTAGIRLGGSTVADAASIDHQHETAMRLIRVRHALVNIGSESALVLRCFYAEESFLSRWQRRIIAEFGAMASTMMLTPALQRWATENQLGHGAADALRLLHSRTSEGKPGASTALSKVREESDAMLAVACERYEQIAGTRKERER